MNKKIVLYSWIVLLSLIVIVLYLHKYCKNGYNKKSEVDISYYIKGDDGEYQRIKKYSEFPSKYELNAKSYCVNKSELKWDIENDGLSLKAIGPDKCYAYFHKVSTSPVIEDIQEANSIYATSDYFYFNPPTFDYDDLLLSAMYYSFDDINYYELKQAYCYDPGFGTTFSCYEGSFDYLNDECPDEVTIYIYAISVGGVRTQTKTKTISYQNACAPGVPVDPDIPVEPAVPDEDIPI